MKRYILTLAPEDGTGTTATAHIDVNGDGPRLKQITFTAADGGYLPQMPFDIEGFIAAVMPSSAPAAPRPLAAPPRQTNVDSVAVVDTPPVEAASTVRGTKHPAATGGPAEAAKKAAAPVVPSLSGSAVKTAEAKKVTAGKTATAKKATAKKAPAKTAAAVAVADTEKGRVYHRMPDDFVQTYGKTTLADLASVYQVPLHTVAAWVKTARRQKLIPEAIPRKKR